MRRTFVAALGLVLLTALAGAGGRFYARRHAFAPVPLTIPVEANINLNSFQRAIIADLNKQLKAGIRYADGYYDGGDPPASIGVCTDVVIRGFRSAGVNLQQELAADVRAHPEAYGIQRPDSNIDHRRCRNLAVFFARRAKKLLPDSDWEAGDIVFWDTYGDGRTDHVGLVACGRDSRGEPTIIHHWPGMPVAETNGLHRFTVKGHYRWDLTQRRKAIRPGWDAKAREGTLG